MEPAPCVQPAPVGTDEGGVKGANGTSTTKTAQGLAMSAMGSGLPGWVQRGAALGSEMLQRATNQAGANIVL